MYALWMPLTGLLYPLATLYNAESRFYGENIHMIKQNLVESTEKQPHAKLQSCYRLILR